MSNILPIIFPIFASIAIGYACVWKDVISQKGLKTLGQFVLYIALPSLITLNLSQLDLTTSFKASFFIAYALGSIGTYGVIFAVSKFIFKNNKLDSALNALGSSFSNSAFIAFPLLMQIFDSEYISYFIMILLFENMIMMPLVLSLLEYSASPNIGTSFLKNLKQTLFKLTKHPLIISVSIGLCLSLLDIPLPGTIKNTLDFFGKSSTALALFFIGGSLIGINLKGERKRIVMVSFAKLLLHPTLVGSFAYILTPHATMDIRVAILFACVPAMSIYSIIGSKYGQNDFCSSVSLFSTTLSILTISIILFLFVNS